MTQVLQPPSVVTAGHKRRRLTEAMVVQWTHQGRTHRVRVPADGRGYEVSAPRPLRALMALLAPYYSLEDVSAAHDYLYRVEGQVGSASLLGRTEISRAAADAVLFADAEDPAWLQWAAWAYVRAVGGWAWDPIHARIS